MCQITLSLDDVKKEKPVCVCVTQKRETSVFTFWAEKMGGQHLGGKTAALDCYYFMGGKIAPGMLLPGSSPFLFLTDLTPKKE